MGEIYDKDLFEEEPWDRRIFTISVVECDESYPE
jgi:hypothetical protein